MSEVEIDGKTDAELIAAIRGGERDLFRELVERHSPAVFGIAWSRLGDRVLAEEAAQETFIKAFTTLGLLRHSEKFSGWLATIARHVAINLGLRHRREIEKRERWQLEQTPDSAEEQDDSPELPQETIQSTLASLSGPHRETLVLYYLEGKSISEAASALGISETAFKTRLHRARKSMRSALESKLETSLKRMRPSANFAGMVMLGLPLEGRSLISSGGVLASLFKLSPALWLPLAIQFATLVPTLIVARWLGRRDQANFREPDGFRSRILAHMLRRSMWLAPVLIFGFSLAGLPMGLRTWTLLVLSLIALPTLLWSIRRLYAVQNRRTITDLLILLTITAASIGMLLNAPDYWWLYGQSITLLLASLALKSAAWRMDYSLFLRAAEGILSPTLSETIAAKQFSRADLFSFARFLFCKLLVLDWSWEGDSLRLKLAPVTPRVLDAFFPLVWRRKSTLLIAPDGQVSAYSGRSDERDLTRLGYAQPISELAPQVEKNVEAAFLAHVEKRVHIAESYLGEESEAKIFVTSPNRSSAARIRVWGCRIFALLSLMGAIFSQHDHWSGGRQGLDSVKLSEVEFRDGLESTFLPPENQNLQMVMLDWDVKLPERRFFSDRAFAAFQQLIRERLNPPPSTNPVQSRARILLSDGFLQRAFFSGLITAEELKFFDISINDVRSELQLWPTTQWRPYLAREPFRVRHSSYRIFDAKRLNLQVNLLSACGLLENIDISPAVEALTALQIIPETAKDGRWEDLDTEALDGLFRMQQANPLRDTYDVLCVLEKAGALERIDREACIRGILRFYRGRGLFVKDRPGSVNWGIRGDANDTYCAFESLRMLGALDRVKDLDRWQFRSARFSHHDSKNIPWEKLAAYGLARRARVEEFGKQGHRPKAENRLEPLAQK